MKRRRADESADGLALMTSSVTSSYSADGLREQSQESAGSLYIQTQERSDVVEEEIQSQATVHQQMLFGDSNSKTIRKDPDARKADVAKNCNQAQSIQSTKISAEDEFSRCDKSAAKQLTIYERWMSTAELNSNGENDKKPAKEKDTSTVPLSVLYRTILNGKNVVSNGIKFYRGYIFEKRH
ncbi:hypothetical protein F511_22617 [Dorcoceras hygrometricum]|uniref:Uncharacterized protein n=1 Tax=Dorcoceras hygrometricum TaxID=472368 RepID=A0A2Z7AIR3_9LAMI|nr:hypothetical protein F511_22617 [Dorcoceras hygrometricum]